MGETGETPLWQLLIQRSCLAPTHYILRSSSSIFYKAIFTLNSLKGFNINRNVDSTLADTRHSFHFRPASRLHGSKGKNNDRFDAEKQLQFMTVGVERDLPNPYDPTAYRENTEPATSIMPISSAMNAQLGVGSPATPPIPFLEAHYYWLFSGLIG